MNRTVTRFALCMLFLVALLVSGLLPSHAQDEPVLGTFTVTVPTANLRAGASTTYAIVRVVQISDRFDVLDQAQVGSHVWYKLALPGGASGWMRGDLGVYHEAPPVEETGEAISQPNELTDQERAERNEVITRERMLELNENYAEALAELGQDWPVYQNGDIQMVRFSPEEFYIVADELRFTQNGREFIWTPKTGWLMEQIRTDNGLRIYLSMQFLDSESREAMGVKGTGLERITYPFAIIPGDGFEMSKHPIQQDFGAAAWSEILGLTGNHEVSSVPGIPAIAKAVDFTWYIIYTHQTNQPGLSFDEFIAKFRSGQANFNISFNGQELLITSETKLQLRAAPNSRDARSNEYVNSAGEIVNLSESDEYRDWFVNQDIVGLMWEIYKDNVPSQDEMLFAYELMQILMPLNSDGQYRQAPAVLIDANGNIVETPYDY